MNSLAACFRSYWSVLSLSLLLSEDEQKLWILLRSSGTGMQARRPHNYSSHHSHNEGRPVEGSASIGLPALGRHKGLVPDLPGGRAHGHQLLCAAWVHAHHRVHHLLGHPHLDRHRKALHASHRLRASAVHICALRAGTAAGEVCLTPAAVHLQRLLGAVRNSCKHIPAWSVPWISYRMTALHQTA